MKISRSGGRRVGLTNAIALLAAGRVAELPRDEQRALLRPHKRPIGARCAIGKKYVDPKALGPMGRALEKRARKAAKRLLDNGGGGV